VNVDGIGVSIPSTLRTSPPSLRDVLALIIEMGAMVGDSEPEASIAQAIAAVDVFDLCRRVRRPCMVVLAANEQLSAGNDDQHAQAMRAWRTSTIAELEAIEGTNPLVRLATLGSSHFLPLEQPDQLAALITQWLLELPST
jgi:hypothetical protein